MFRPLYLDALNEELVQLNTCTSAHKPASAPAVAEAEEQARSSKGQTEVGERDYTVRQLLLFLYTTFERDVANVQIGKFSRFAHLARIRWEVPFDRTRAKPARHSHYRSLEITLTQRPGLFLLSPNPARTDQPPYCSRSPIRYTPFRTHLHASHSHNPCGSANRAGTRQPNRCFSRRFHKFSSSILALRV